MHKAIATTHITNTTIKTCVEYGFDKCWSCGMGNSCPTLWIANMIEAYARDYKDSPDEMHKMLNRWFFERKWSNNEIPIMKLAMQDHFPEHLEWLEKMLLLK
jgi:hypothetical protein